MEKRNLLFYKHYFREFFSGVSSKAQTNILWTLKIIEEVERIPEIYLKHIESIKGLYEIRVQTGNNIFRVFCFFDEHNIVVIGNGFQKKSRKTRPVKLK